MGRIYRASSTCQVPLCLLPVRAKWLCNTHYQRKITGDPNWSRPVRRHKIGAVWIPNFRMWPEIDQQVREFAENLGLRYDDAVNRALEVFFLTRKSGEATPLAERRKPGPNGPRKPLET